MKKVLSIIGIVVLVLVVVLVLFLGHIIKVGIETAGPKVAGVPISVEKVRVNPLTGVVQVKALVIGNPEGFHTPSAMELGEFKLNISLASLFTDTIVIKEILISEPEITYEKSLRSSNLAALQENLAPEEEPAPAEEEEPAEEEAKKAPAKKVVIDEFKLKGAKVNVTLTALGGKKLTLPLPPISMKDIGKDSGGASIVEVISNVLSAVTKAVVEALAASGDFAGEALKDVGGAAGNVMKDVGGAASEAAEGIKKGIGNLLGK